MDLLVDLLFWLLLTVVVFAGCYWLTSEIGRMLVSVTPAATSLIHPGFAPPLLLTLLALAALRRAWLRR
jgi:hypothetical protein